MQLFGFCFFLVLLTIKVLDCSCDSVASLASGLGYQSKLKQLRVNSCTHSVYSSLLLPESLISSICSSLSYFLSFSSTENSNENPLHESGVSNSLFTFSYIIFTKIRTKIIIPLYLIISDTVKYMLIVIAL